MSDEPSFRLALSKIGIAYYQKSTTYYLGC